MTNAQTWTVLIAAILVLPIVLMDLIITWGNKTATQHANEDGLEEKLAPVDAEAIKECVRARLNAPADADRAGHLSDEIDRLTERSSV